MTIFLDWLLNSLIFVKMIWVPYVSEKVTSVIKKNVKRIFHKLAPVLFAFREKVAEELKRLQNQCAIQKVENSLWGTPLVPLLKGKNKDVSNCANYKSIVKSIWKILMIHYLAL